MQKWCIGTDSSVPPVVMLALVLPSGSSAKVLLSVLGGPTGTLANSGLLASSAASTGMPAASALAAPFVLLPAAAVAVATSMALPLCAAACCAVIASSASATAQRTRDCMLLRCCWAHNPLLSRRALLRCGCPAP